MNYQHYHLLHVTLEAGVATVIIDNPPINVMSAALTHELADVCEKAARDERVRVIVFKSADPDFFIAHADVHLFLAHDTAESQAALDTFRAMTKRIRTWDKISIGQIEGRASGGGCEFLEALDMRFAALGKTFLSHPEVSLGFIPCKGGSQRLPPLVGRSRALELILGGAFITAEVAEQYGLINRALMPVALGGFVNRLAERIASHPEQTVRYAKQCVNASMEERESGLALEKHLFERIVATEETQRRLHEYNERVGQQRDKELRMGI